MAIKTRSDVPLNPLAGKPATVRWETLEDPTDWTPKQPAAAPTSAPAAMDKLARVMAEMQRPVTEKIPAKPQASQPVEPSGRGRKPSDDPRQVVGVRLPASLIRDLDAQAPGWKAQIEALLRTHFMPDRR